MAARRAQLEARRDLVQRLLLALTHLLAPDPHAPALAMGVGGRFRQGQREALVGLHLLGRCLLFQEHHGFAKTLRAHVADVAGRANTAAIEGRRRRDQVVQQLAVPVLATSLCIGLPTAMLSRIVPPVPR